MIWQAPLDMALTDPRMLPLDYHKWTEKLHVELRCYQRVAEEFINNIDHLGSYYYYQPLNGLVTVIRLLMAVDE